MISIPRTFRYECDSGNSGGLPRNCGGARHHGRRRRQPAELHSIGSSQTHCSGLTRGHQVVRRSIRPAKRESTEPRLSHHDCNHLTMQRTVVQPYHAVHSHRLQASEVCLKMAAPNGPPVPRTTFSRERAIARSICHIRSVAEVPATSQDDLVRMVDIDGRKRPPWSSSSYSISARECRYCRVNPTAE